MKINEKIFDVQTQTETVIEREATELELAEIQTAEAEAAAAVAAAEAKEAARQALLDKLGITADEAKLLLGSN
jgi:ParB-like chromosome segregation protein Spo0J